LLGSKLTADSANGARISKRSAMASGAGQPPLAGQLATRGIIAWPADLVHEAHCLQNTRGGKGFLPIGQQSLCVGRWISCNK
jgi:hypothetical protein